MKKFKRSSKKLFVQKETIAHLNDFEMTKVKGGSPSNTKFTENGPVCEDVWDPSNTNKQ